MLKIKPSYWFLISWILITGISGMWSHFQSGPDGMHQGAQADRACVAWNYYSRSMNFFEPRVMENRAADGIAGMEFPIMNYSAALLYKVFGPKEWLYRALMFLVVTMGVWASFSITGFFIKKTLSRLLLIYGWFLSPIFLFYGNNFVPDPAALSFSMVALYFFFKYYFQLQIRQSMYLYMVFMALAGLIKITFLIPHFGLLGIAVISHLNPRLLPMGFPKLKQIWAMFLVPLLPAAAWYIYAAKLTQKTGNEHFLQRINPAHSIPDFIENTRYAFNTWHDSIYAPNYIYILLLVYLFSIITKWKNSPLIAGLSLLTTLGFIAAFVLFNFQYRYHDYYFFLLLPAVFFMLLFLQQVYLEGQRFFMGLFPIVLVLAFYFLPFGNFFHARKMLSERYTPGSYYHQVAYPEASFYYSLRFKLDPLIPKNAQVCSAFDPSPNTSLYLMRRRGIRVADDFSEEMVRDMLQKQKIDYLVLNDSVKWVAKYPGILLQNSNLLYRNNILTVWKLNGINVSHSLNQN